MHDIQAEDYPELLASHGSDQDMIDHVRNYKMALEVIVIFNNTSLRLERQLFILLLGTIVKNVWHYYYPMERM